MVFCLIVFQLAGRYFCAESTTMKKTDYSHKPVLIPLKKKFREAGCECTLQADEHHTVLKISYANIVVMPQPSRSAG